MHGPHKNFALHIADPEPGFVGNKVGPQYIRDIRMKELLTEHQLVRKHSDFLKEKNIDVDGLLIAGATAKLILEEVEKLKIDLVIIGRHQHSLLYKIFTGTIHSAVVNKSKVPVLIVPL